MSKGISIKYEMDALPRVSAACAIVKSPRVVRYSIKSAAKIAVLIEFDHKSFQRQNWFLGIIAARAEVVSLHPSNTGRTESNNAGTNHRASSISPDSLDMILQN